MTQLLTGIVFAVAAVAIFAWVQAQLFTWIYRQGYVRGMEDAGRRFADWEARVEKQVDQARQEIQDEGRCP